jgi:hypothetical protein
LSSGGREWCLFGLLAGEFLTLVHLLDEGFGFLLIGKGKSCRALFKLEGMEEGTVLIVVKAIIYLLVPDHASTGRLQHSSINQ